MAKSPFETRGSTRVSTKNNFQRRPQAARLPCGQRPLMKTNLRIGFQFCGCAAPPFSVHGLAEQVGHSLTGKYPTGVFSDSARLLRRRTKAKGWTTYGLPPSLKNIPPEYFLRYARKSRTAAHLERARLRRILRRALVPLGTRLPSSSGLLCAADRVGKYELRTADACRPALLFVLALRCGSILYGTTAVQYRFSAVWALRAAV